MRGLQRDLRSEMTQTTNGAKVDLHCHSAASAVAKLGVQRALGLPECATPPAEVHAGQVLAA